MRTDDESRSEREEAQVFALLRQLDHPPPSVTADSLVQRAHRGGPERGWQRWAAGIVLVGGLAGVAYAAPGSPLPGWARRVSEWMREPALPPALPPAAPGTVQAPPEASTAGVAIPAGRELVVVFTTAEPASAARISFTDGAEVVVRALQGAATFTSDLDRLVIDNRIAASTFDISIPRSSPRVEIRVKNDRIFLKEGGHVTPAPPGTGEVHILRLAPGD